MPAPSPSPSAPLSFAQLARALGAQLIGPAERAAQPVHALAPLDRAQAHHLAAAFEPRHQAQLAHTTAGAVLLARDLPARPPHCLALICADPRLAFGRALRLLHGPSLPDAPPEGADARAALDATAQIHPTARIGPFVYVGPRAQIGEGAVLCAGAYVGADSRIGAHSWLWPGARVLQGCHLGACVRVGANAVIGSVGFGLDAGGRLPHIGGVVIADDVWIGANSCVDRGTLGDTRVEVGAQIDNLVQVAHNCVVGAGAVLCGQVGLAGGARVEAGAVLGGQAGVAGHRTVGAGARVAAQSGVTRDLPGHQEYSGHPAEPNRPRLRRLARLRRLVASQPPAAAPALPRSIAPTATPPVEAPAALEPQS